MIDAVRDLFDYVCNWRFFVSAFASFVLAGAVASEVAAEPLCSIVAGAIAVAGLVIGWRWNGAR